MTINFLHQIHDIFDYILASYKKGLVQGGGYNFLPCEVVDKFNCIQDQAFKAEVENVIRGLAREATYLLKNGEH